ncbi:ATP-binding cassette domain-containing protein [Sinorhizobium meliloti]|nr:ATP-binding cassette domain-containing protein [Sinorhizobium meliloti]
MFEPLFKYGHEGNIEPGLATEWSVEEGGKLLNVTLREGVTFHDGTPFDATALKWNLERWIGMEANNWMNSSRLFAGLDIVDARHVRIRFREPVLGLLQEFTYVRPVRFLSPRSVAEDGSYRQPVGTGPWRQVSATNEASVFERYEEYWGEKPAFPKLEVRVLPDSRGRMAALRAGDIDLIGGAFASPITATEAQTLSAAGVHVVIDPGTTLDLIRMVGISDPSARLRQYPHELSGGLRQRVMIAIAVAAEPKLLIADEPTTALDVTVQAQILKLLKEIQAKLEMAMVLTTHDMGVVASAADRVVVMYAGRNVETGPVEKVLVSPRHPYTMGLIDAIPSRSDPIGSPFRGLPGMPPVLSAPIPGCAFEPRCPHAVPACRTQRPELERTADAAIFAACPVLNTSCKERIG